MGLIKDFWSSEDGATSIEYALIGVIVSIGLIASTQEIAAKLHAMLEGVASKFDE
ncbi:Flp family type IVb pilin [Hyphomicrobium sp.]|uniref:Flp family type IVb pilin n=1 Tax=Hyphomicrobium sp. TaxID=82 RepID=UPI0025C286E4|nr:Flp family type IVb pilin [Hyphomicrobium sp.]MCC7253622.1 Flp family type IVb pilin [Hyphomicrobium sp.]